jgi:N-acyl amino acid synthase of PEP-CTERM/exosortase system
MSILDAFNQYFEMIPADSKELKQEVYKLRYQVYCLERGFEDLENHPDGMEHDEYDIRSSHYLIRHIKTGSYMATTRLVLPDKQNLDNPFPVEAHSQIDNVALLQTMQRPNLAELSRFCVSKEFRRRKNEQDLIITNDTDNSRSLSERKHSASITLALFACAVRISSEHNIHYWIALIEPALKRVVAPLGINVTEIGPLVDYHGMRFPCAISVNDVLQGANDKDFSYWEMLTNNGEFSLLDD